jgi:hypothetical protein
MLLRFAALDFSSVGLHSEGPNLKFSAQNDESVLIVWVSSRQRVDLLRRLPRFELFDLGEPV